MNRFNWTYLSDNGKRYHVGIMHGAESGHLLVYCNSNIILIDFEVLEDKSYSFFIDEQLCEISIERKGKDFLYGFEIDRKADTPLNRQRKRIEKKQLIQSILLLMGFILLVGGFVVGLKKWNHMKDKAALADELAARGLETKAQVLVAPQKQGDYLTYIFLVDGKSYTMEQAVENSGPIVTKTGMPIEKGDEFVVRYIPYNPKLHAIDYSRPTNEQIVTYQQRAVSKQLKHNPEQDSTFALCLAKVAFDLKGVEGYADLYFQNVNPTDNPQHNELTYKRLIRDVPFQKQMAERCQLLQ